MWVRKTSGAEEVIGAKTRLLTFSAVCPGYTIHEAFLRQRQMLTCRSENRTALRLRYR